MPIKNGPIVTEARDRQKLKFEALELNQQTLSLNEAVRERQSLSNLIASTLLVSRTSITQYKEHLQTCQIQLQEANETIESLQNEKIARSQELDDQTNRTRVAEQKLQAELPTTTTLRTGNDFSEVSGMPHGLLAQRTVDKHRFDELVARHSEEMKMATARYDDLAGANEALVLRVARSDLAIRRMEARHDDLRASNALLVSWNLQFARTIALSRQTLTVVGQEYNFMASDRRRLEAIVGRLSKVVFRLKLIRDTIITQVFHTLGVEDGQPRLDRMYDPELEALTSARMDQYVLVAERLLESNRFWQHQAWSVDGELRREVAKTAQLQSEVSQLREHIKLMTDVETKALERYKADVAGFQAVVESDREYIKMLEGQMDVVCELGERTRAAIQNISRIAGTQCPV